MQRASQRSCFWVDWCLGCLNIKLILHGGCMPRMDCHFPYHLEIGTHSPIFAGGSYNAVHVPGQRIPRRYSCWTLCCRTYTRAFRRRCRLPGGMPSTYTPACSSLAVPGRGGRPCIWGSLMASMTSAPSCAGSLGQRCLQADTWFILLPLT